MKRILFLVVLLSSTAFGLPIQKTEKRGGDLVNNGTKGVLIPSADLCNIAVPNLSEASLEIRFNIKLCPRGAKEYTDFVYRLYRKQLYFGDLLVGYLDGQTIYLDYVDSEGAEVVASVPIMPQSN